MSRVSTARAREHVLSLLASGLGTRSIAEMAQLNRGTVRWLLRNELMTSAVEEAILAVRPKVVGPKNVVDSTGTHRRIKGLVAVGWATKLQADLVGRHVGPYRSSLRHALVLRSTAEEVRVIYDKLSMLVPDSPRSGWVRLHARRRRYFPPLAWDDDTIDCPEALPCLLPPVSPCDPALELAVQHYAAGHDIDLTRDVRRELILRTTDRPIKWTAKFAQCSYELVRQQRLEVAA